MSQVDLHKEKAQMELVLAKVLRFGILLSLFLLAAGLLFYLLQGGHGASLDKMQDFQIFQHLASHGLWHPISMMLVGLALLILTPIFRVLATFILFLQEGDRLYVLFTSLVMVIILLSILLGVFFDIK